MARTSKNKMGFLIGSILIPSPNDPFYPPWERCNTLLMSWIINSVSRSQILLMDPLPSINRVFSMVIQNERQHATIVSPLDAPNDFANNVISPSTNAIDARFFHGKTRGGGGGGPSGRGSGGKIQQARSSKMCVYCKRTGHTVDVCYSKHGYPPGHPRYPGRPHFYNPNSGSSSTNYTAIDD
uniref:Retrotransposon Copia-like N-terminal domain-containing protein n=1 Tax=Cajanus cajan TaxID=3821 RepID=A0A151RUE6_CAJCA|nr:hypothetical protein KK1_032274 [Cajanus cajan]